METFFAGVQNSPQAAQFTALKDLEGNIRTADDRGNGNTTFPQFQENMTDKIGGTGGVVDTIFTDPAKEAEFRQYFEAYKQWYYLISRDWQTEASNAGTVTAQTAADAYKTAVTGLAGVATPGSNTSYNNDRATQFNVPYNYGTIRNNLKAQMKTKIIEALGLPNDNTANGINAAAMADALIAQFEDSEELHAFKVDVQQSSHLTTVLSATNYNFVASVAPQSNVRLADLSDPAAFSPDLVKSGERTNGFTPYKKDENGIA